MDSFDLELTIESGQTPTFTWEKTAPQRFRRIAGKDEVWLGKGRLGGCLKSSPTFSRASVRRLFRLQDDVSAIYADLAEDDAVLAEAVRRFAGLRLTESDPWESTVCFLVSQNNNIPRIKQIVRGLHVRPDGLNPASGGIMRPEKLVHADVSALKMGYREAFLKQTARLVAENGFSFERLRRRGLDEARDALMELPGVGPKVADCILLYGLGRTEAFPQDVWVKKAVATWYGVTKENNVKEFAAEKWGNNAGYAQQLLFCHAREQL